jgi:3-isopropylmalate/(R)-2-methylmalate dehydratase large subunit
LMPSGRDFIVATRSAAHETGIQLFDIHDPDQGIVHVISPELGIALPGLSVICPDSHTCTLGGLGRAGLGGGVNRGRTCSGNEHASGHPTENDACSVCGSHG